MPDTDHPVSEASDLRRWLPGGATLAVVVGLWLAPVPEGLTAEAWHLFALFLGSIVAVVAGVLPILTSSVLAVGAAEDIRKAAAEVGDSPRDLNYPHLVPVFLTIALGVAVGLVPIHLHGMPAPVKLGLAGGPLLVAILLSRLGRIGPLVFWLPISANFMLREIGIALFLAAVGLRSGEGFVETLVKGPGLTWMAIGAAITLVPILLVGAVARAAFRVNFLTLTGVIAGSMTDPPALAFANGLAGSEAPTLGYVAVYPLTMILRIVSAEVLVLLLAH